MEPDIALALFMSEGGGPLLQVASGLLFVLPEAFSGKRRGRREGREQEAVPAPEASGLKNSQRGAGGLHTCVWNSG
jgi:hypothetical protein